LFEDKESCTSKFILFAHTLICTELHRRTIESIYSIEHCSEECRREIKWKNTSTKSLARKKKTKEPDVVANLCDSGFSFSLKKKRKKKKREGEKKKREKGTFIMDILMGEARCVMRDWVLFISLREIVRRRFLRREDQECP